jgi:hypothetical protein
MMRIKNKEGTPEYEGFGRIVLKTKTGLYVIGHSEIVLFELNFIEYVKQRYDITFG